MVSKLKMAFKPSKALVYVQNNYETLFCFYGRTCQGHLLLKVQSKILKSMMRNMYDFLLSGLPDESTKVVMQVAI